MDERIVVAFRTTEFRRHPEEHLAGARSLSEQAAAMGGRLVSWGAAVFAFEFPVDALEDAIELAISVALDSVPGHAFAIGISEGRLDRTEDATAKISIAWGAPLVRANVLAQTAKPGEALIDPRVGAVKRGEVLTLGARVGVLGTDRLRALVLDIKHPWRSALAESVASLEHPAFVGRPELDTFDVPAGGLGVVRANHGYGGTRFLAELEHRLEPARALRITPHPLGEPLGGLRRALLRAVTLGHAPLAFGGQLGQSLDSLLAGEGLDPDGAAELLIAWLTPDSESDPSGVVLVDDADELDADTLEVIAHAASISQSPFRVVARIQAASPVPAALDAIEIAAEVSLAPLPLEAAVELALNCTRRELDPQAAERWARRGGSVPLAVVEALYEGLEGGELVWEEGRATGRLRGAGGGDAKSARHWIRRRFDYLEPEAQTTLRALCILGGEAEVRDLHDLVRRHSDGKFDANTARPLLESGGWAVRVKPDMLALASTTHKNAILSTLADDQFAAWHASACSVFERRNRPLAIASATAHAFLSGDARHAAELAKRAAAASRAVGLENAAQAFDQHAETRDPRPLIERGLLASQLDTARSMPSYVPDMPPEPERVAERLSLPDDAPIPESLPPDVLEDDDDEDRITQIPSWRVAKPRAAGADDNGAPKDDGSEPPLSAVAALRNGDVAAVQRLAGQLRGEEGRGGLADRLEAMVHLARGETGDALRRLREAAEAAKRENSAEQCRASLALGVALAAANRTDEALFAALEGLARARERADKRGERACARFLAQLARGAGHPDVAAAWQALAQL